MKITMLGTTGSGKTSYMSMMMKLFIHDTQNGYYLKDAGGSLEQSVLLQSLINKVDTITQGRFPSATTKNSVLQLILMYGKEELIDVDWIDYKGGNLTDIDLENDDTKEIIAALISSDVTIVFIDSEIIATEANDIVAKKKTGIDDLVFLLNLVSNRTGQSRHNVLFVLSKADSDISQKYGENALINRCNDLLKLFFVQCPNVRYSYVCVGCIGIGRVKSTIAEKDNGYGQLVSVISDQIVSTDLRPHNVAASFAYCLYLACSSAKETTLKEINAKSRALERLSSDFSCTKKIIDFLFNKSKRRFEVYTLSRTIELEQQEMKNLEHHESNLHQLWMDAIRKPAKSSY